VNKRVSLGIKGGGKENVVVGKVNQNFRRGDNFPYKAERRSGRNAVKDLRGKKKSLENQWPELPKRRV